jgi:hypothetical protein
VKVRSGPTTADDFSYRVYGPQEDLAPAAKANPVHLNESAAGLVTRLERR